MPTREETRKRKQAQEESAFSENLLNIQKEMEKVMKNQAKAAFAFSKEISSSINGMLEMEHSQEKISKSKSISLRLGKEIKYYQDLERIALKDMNVARIAGRAAEYELAKASRADIRARLKDMENFKDQIRQQIPIMKKYMMEQENLLTVFKNYQLAGIFGFQKYTGTVDSFITKIQTAFGGGSKIYTKVLEFIKAWYFELVGILLVVNQIFQLFKDLDKSAWESRKAFGMMRKEHEGIRRSAEELVRQYAHLGVTADIAYKSTLAISRELGTAQAASLKLNENIALMSAQFGIVEDIAVKTLKTLAQFGGTTAAAQVDMVEFSAAMASAVGIPLPDVMMDVAKASETTRIMMSKTPLELIKATIEARRLGTALDKMASSSRKILDFTDSIQAEMEASVLTGQSINLQHARELSYRGKIIEANKEMLRIANQINFEAMDPYQAEAFARAIGKSAEEIQSMLQADREQRGIREEANKQAAVGNRALLNQLETYEKLKNVNEAAAKLAKEDFATKLKTQANQARLVAVSNAWKKVLIELGNAFLPLIDNILKVTAAVIPLFSYFIPIVGIVTALGKVVGFVGKAFGLLKFATPLLKAVPIIGWIITAFTFLGSLFKRFSEMDWTKGFINGVIQGIGAIIGALYDALIKPFWDALKWIGSWFKGNSPSKVGRMILDGISAIGKPLLDALIWPFKMWMYGVKKIVSFMGNVLLTPFKWIANAIGIGPKPESSTIEAPILNSKIASIAVSTDKLERRPEESDSRSYKELDNIPNAITDVSQTNISNLEQLSTMIDLQTKSLETLLSIKDSLEQGKIAVQMDGQLVSTVMNRGIKFRGQFGAIV